jgi:hypothetical protein
MEKYYKKDFTWSDENSEVTGLPRPYVVTPERLHFAQPLNFSNKFKKYLHKIVPMPWQSIPLFINEGAGLLSVHIDHEEMVVTDNLCGYCGNGFSNEELCCRWISNNRYISKDGLGGPRVYSDVYPLHLECMKQARKFCPFMRTLSEKDFEFSEHNILLKKIQEELKEPIDLENSKNDLF